MNRRGPWSLAVAVAAGALGLCACSAVLGLREIDPLPSGDGGNASDGGGPGVEGGGPARAWMSGFLLRSVVDDTYRTQSADDAQRWFTNIGTWRTGTSRNNCTIFDSIAYPDPGQAQTALDYLFGTLSGGTWGLPARFVPSSVGLQPLWSTPLTHGNDVGLRDTNDGNADASLGAWFTKLVAYGQGNAIVRLGWEMGGAGYPWSIAAPINLDATTGYGTPDGAAAAYKAAYRRVVDIARGVPGQSFRFEWNGWFQDADYGTVHVLAATVASAYPGGPDKSGVDYVDFVGMAAFDRNNSPATPPVAQGTGAMAAGSLVLTDWTTPSSRHFSKTDVGKSVHVYTAGPHGGATTDFPLFAKVVSVDTTASPPTATLGVAASRAVTGAMVVLFDAWPTQAIDDLRTSLAALAAFARAKQKPVGVSWAPSLKMDGHGGNDDDVYVQAMYDFFAAPANNVAYETVYEGIDGTDVGPLAKSVLYPMPKQAAGGKNGPFHDGADSLPLATARYHALFGAR